MAGESDNNDKGSDDSNNNEQSNDTKLADTVKELTTKLEEQSAKFESQSELVEKLRKFEKENKESADSERKKREGVEGELDAVKDMFNTKLRDLSVDAAIDKALAGSDAHDTDTVKVMIDRSSLEVSDSGRVDAKQLAEIVAGLQESKPFLFKDKDSNKEDGSGTKNAKAARPGEGKIDSGYAKEMAGAKTTKEINTIMKKYNV